MLMFLTFLYEGKPFMNSKHKFPVGQFVMTGICAALLSACGSSGSSNNTLQVNSPPQNNAQQSYQAAQTNAGKSYNTAQSRLTTAQNSIKSVNQSLTSTQNVLQTVSQTLNQAATIEEKKNAAAKATNGQTQANNVLNAATAATTQATAAQQAAQAALDQAKAAASAASSDIEKQAAAENVNKAEALLTQANTAQKNATQAKTVAQQAVTQAQTLKNAADKAYADAVAADNANKTAEQKATAALASAQTAVNSSTQAAQAAQTAQATSTSDTQKAANAKTAAEAAAKNATDFASKKLAVDKASAAQAAAATAVKSAQAAASAAVQAINAAQTAKAEADKAVASATDSTRTQAAALQKQATQQLATARAAKTAADQLVVSNQVALTAAQNAKIIADNIYALEKNIQDKLVILKTAGDNNKETVVFTKQEMDTGFLAREFAAPQLLENQWGEFKGLYKASNQELVRPSNSSSYYDRVSRHYLTGSKISGGYFISEYTGVSTKSPLSAKNLIGTQIYTKDGKQYESGETVKILNQTASPFELSGVKGDRYTHWFNNFDTSADNNIYLDKGRRILSQIQYSVDVDNNPQWTVSSTPSEGDQLSRQSNGILLDDLYVAYVNQNGEYATRVTLEKDLTFTLYGEDNINLWKALGWQTDKSYFMPAGSYFFVEKKDGSIAIEKDTGQMTQVSEESIRVGIDNNAALGAFKDKRVIAEVFSARHYGKVNEQRALHTYDVGKANGYNQAYLSLNLWQFKDEAGNYAANKPFNIGIADRLGDMLGSQGMYVYDAKNQKGLVATYNGVAYSDKDGLQDGVMKMTAQFHRDHKVDFNGAITKRRLDDQRDIYFASGDVKVGSGMPAADAGKAVFLSGGYNHTDNVTTWMAGKYGDENRVIYGSGIVKFAGPQAEEVGGILNIKTHHGENNIGFVGKR